MPVDFPGTIPDLLTRFGLNPLSFSNYQDLLRELQALFNATGTNPAGSGGTIDGRIDAIEARLGAPALAIITATSGNIANTTTETAFSNGSYTVPANSAVIGRSFRINAGGSLSTPVGNTAALTISVRWGGTNTDPLMIRCGPSATLAANLTNAGWFFNGIVTVRTIGATGSAVGSGALTAEKSPVTDLGTPVTTIDTTTAKNLTMFATWSVANASNTINLDTFVVEQLG